MEDIATLVQAAKRVYKIDPELEVMKKIRLQLDPLPFEVRLRVLKWVLARAEEDVKNLETEG